MTRDRIYLQHILTALERVRVYTQDGYDAFRGNPMAQDAVIRNFEIIGEAAKRIGPETKGRVEDIPWRAISGFRNVLIHQYMGVDIDEVWNVVVQHTDPLDQRIRRLLSEME